MTNSLVALRNTVSGVVQEYSEAEAARWLSHPTFGKVLEIVRTNKPEVLNHPVSGDDELEFDEFKEEEIVSEQSKTSNLKETKK